MKYKDVLIRLASMTLPYVYDDTISFLELDRKLYKIVHELIVAMQGLSTDYDNLKNYVDDYFKNLDLESEVQTIINQMVDDGTLADIINDELLTEINQNIEKLTSDIETINGSITTIDERIDTANTNIDTNSNNIKTLKNKTQIQNATCEENANYILTNPDFKIEANDVIFIHFNTAIDKSADATLTINDVAKNVIKEDGSLYKGQDIENKDLILKVASAGLMQIVDIVDLQEQINTINTNFNKNVLDLIYPIGSIIYNDNESFDPNTVFGGTWEKIKGKMVIGLDDADDDFNTLKATGGNKTHVQTVDELAKHNHGNMGDSNPNSRAAEATASGGGGPTAFLAVTNAASFLQGEYIRDTGTSKPMDIMNPYYVANIWRRTA